MKKTTLLIIVLLSLNICYANKILSNTNLLIEDTFYINEIQFSRSGNPGWDSRDLLKKIFYILIFKFDGTAILKWNGKCPSSRNNSLICSYYGKISKKDFNRLAKKLNEIKFTEFKDEYTDEGDDIGAEGYLINYNSNNQKKIIDQRCNIECLQEFSEMLDKLKKEIIWIPKN